MTAEADVLSAVLDLLQAVRVPAWRMNSGMMVAEHKGRKRVIRFGGAPGMADLLAIPTVRGVLAGQPCSWCMPLFVECKSPTGRQSPEQRSFEKKVCEAGAEYLLVRDPDTLKDWLVARGVIR